VNFKHLLKKIFNNKKQLLEKILILFITQYNQIFMFFVFFSIYKHFQS